jgi:Pectate lyase superfamily protein
MPLLPMLTALLPLCLDCAPAPAAQVAEYEAENQTTSGIILAPERSFGTAAAEASGRSAVQLGRPGEFIRVRLDAPVRGLTIRYSVSPSGRWGRKSATVLIEADGQPLREVRLASAYSAQPVAHAARGRPVHHFWDEARLLLPRSLPAGTTLTLRLAANAGARPVAIDLIDAEDVAPPGLPPQGSIVVGQFGADPTGRRSSRAAFLRAIRAARQQRRPLYVPPGHYRVDGHVVVDRVAIAGAGSWYSIIAGHHLGFYSRRAGSSGVSLSGIAIQSDVSQRQDRAPLAAIGGRFSNSSFTHLYVNHAKAGIWLDGPAHDLLVRAVVIADEAADGINLHRGIRNALVESNRIRNTGDDAIASWSDGIANESIVIRNNRIATPGLGNGIAIYGGRDITVVGNRVADVLVEGGGIHLGARFGAAPFDGRIVVANNILTRAATMDPHWHFGVGAIWIYALERPIAADIRLVGNRIADAACEAVQLLGPKRIDGVRVEDLQIAGPVTSVFALQTGGSVVAARVTTDVAPADPIVDVPSALTLGQEEGNRGWTARKVEEPRPPGCRM